MKKIIIFIILFMFGVNVEAESLDISLANNNKFEYFFDMLVKDVKDSKINVISGVFSYDKEVFTNFEIAAQNGWDLQTVKEENRVKFILTHMTDYAAENQKIMGINAVVKASNKEIKISLDNIVSSSSESAINVSDVTFKHEVSNHSVVKPDDKVDVPDQDIINKIEDNKNEEEKPKEEKDNGKKAVRTRDIISLIIFFLVLGVVIVAGIFAYKENKKDGGK